MSMPLILTVSVGFSSSDYEVIRMPSARRAVSRQETQLGPDALLHPASPSPGYQPWLPRRRLKASHLRSPTARMQHTSKPDKGTGSTAQHRPKMLPQRNARITCCVL